MKFKNAKKLLSLTIVASLLTANCGAGLVHAMQSNETEAPTTSTAKKIPATNNIGQKIEQGDLVYEVLSEDTVSVSAIENKKAELVAMYIPETVKLPDNKEYRVITIGKNAFANCAKLEAIHIPFTVETIGEYAFSACENLEHIMIPISVTFINKGTFSNCIRLARINIPNNFFEHMYYYSGRSLAKMHCTVTEIGEKAFENCKSLEKFIIPGNVKKIGDHAFANSGLISVKIEEGVETIGKNAFHKCSSLKYINSPNDPLPCCIFLPKSIKEIEKSAFADMPMINTLTISGEKTKVSVRAFVQTVERKEPLTIRFPSDTVWKNEEGFESSISDSIIEYLKSCNVKVEIIDSYSKNIDTTTTTTTSSK